MDNVGFVRGSIDDFGRALEQYGSLVGTLEREGGHYEAVADWTTLRDEVDLDGLTSEVRQALGECRRGLYRVRTIVAAMSEFAQPERRDRAGVDLNRALRTKVTVAESDWKGEIEVGMDLDESLAAVPCAPGALNQVLLTVLVNAVQAIRDRPEGSDPGRICITTRRRDGAAEIRIEDDGCGMPQDVRERVFEPFFTTRPVGRGTGRGLSFVYATIVEEHGGEVGVESELGRGACFTLRLPLGNAGRDRAIAIETGTAAATGTESAGAASAPVPAASS